MHNVGLIYYETEEYDKAAIAFEQALEIEGDHASRHIAYAKVQEKLGHNDKMIASLETAARFEPSVQTFNILADAYERYGRGDEAASLRDKVARAVARHNTPKRVTQQRRVVM